MIPKKIHCCWFGGKEKDELSKRCIESWKRVLPDYEIIEWNESNFDVGIVPFVKQAYEAKQWAFVADYVRLWALANHGGIYLDCDVEVFKPFDEYLGLKAFTGYEQKSHKGFIYLEAAVIGSEQGGKWISGLVELYDNRNFIKEDGSYDMSVIPVIMAEYTQNNFMPIDGQNTESCDELTIFDHKYFSPKNAATNEIEPHKETVCVHHFNNSWGAPYCKQRGEYKSKYGSKLGVLMFGLIHPIKSIRVLKYRSAERKRRKAYKK